VRASRCAREKNASLRGARAPEKLEIALLRVKESMRALPAPDVHGLKREAASATGAVRPRLRFAMVEANAHARQRRLLTSTQSSRNVPLVAPKLVLGDSLSEE
jgi:hypothetical protein